MNNGAPGWYPDPMRRFELRYHNGHAWTADVSDGGSRYVDPQGTRPSERPSPPTPVAADAKNPAATASMVLGILAVAVGWVPMIVVVGAVAAVLALIFGVKGRRRARRSGVGGGFALTGLITGAVGLLVCVGGVLFTVSLLRAVDRYNNPAEHTASITSCRRAGDDVTAQGELTNLATKPDHFAVRVFFVRPGTDNPRRAALVELGRVDAGETVAFELTRAIGSPEVDCIVGAVRGPLPYGVDPGS